MSPFILAVWDNVLCFPRVSGDEPRPTHMT